MKLIVNQDLQIPETEITIRCACMDSRLERLINQIRQYAFSLTGYQEDKEYQLPLDQIFSSILWTAKPFVSGEGGLYLPGYPDQPGRTAVLHLLHPNQQKLPRQYQLP